MKLPKPDHVVDEYFDVLQNIEFAIHQTFVQHPELLDYQVNKVLEGLERTIKASQSGRTPPTLRFTPLEQPLYDAVKSICDWRSGQVSERPAVLSSPLMAQDTINPITADEIIICLKRVQKSIKLWTTESGMRGYLNYIDQFFPK